MDIRRTLLWLIFSFSLLLLWNNWQQYTGNPSMFSNVAAENSQQVDAGTTAATPSSSNIPTASVDPVTGIPNPNAPLDIPVSEVVTVETDVFRIDFDTIGAQLVKAELLKFTEPDTDQPVVLLDKTDSFTYIAQSGVVGAAGQKLPNHLTPFALQSKQLSMDNNDSLEVVFAAEDDGVRVIKTYTFTRGSYDIHVQHTIQNNSDATINPSLYLQLERDDTPTPNFAPFAKTYTGPVVYSEAEKFQKVSFSDVEKGKANYIKVTNNGWIGMVQHYFASAWVPPQGTERTNAVIKETGSNHFYIRTFESVGAIEPQHSTTVEAQLWVGPQDQKAMSAVAPGLDLVVDYGWLTILAKPLYSILAWLHGLVGNWGWAIVLLTLLIKVVFYPLSAASYRSMAKMKQVAPRMKALREQYGDDKAKLNAAMMDMYRTEKINPVGGCLPMLVQIPVFIALYWVLLSSVEMRGAPWILWIHDLATRDPYMILPAIMMGTMFLQIKLNPTPPDPMQARIMMIMPLVFGGMMFFFPAGLVLYWCVNNILSIAQQQLINHRINKEAQAKAIG